MKHVTKVFFEHDANSKYPQTSYFSPRESYPESPFTDVSEKDNDVYRMIRAILCKAQYDNANYGTERWNPLGSLIKKGDTVLIKPNLVLHVNKAENDLQRGLDCMITHPSLVRAIFDYVYIALQGVGKIIIADAPVQDCDWNQLITNSGYEGLFHFFQNKQTESLQVVFADLRETVRFDEDGIKKQVDNPVRAFGSTVVDLQDNSYFKSGINKKGLRITNYAGVETVKHHSKGKNEYCISDAVLKSNVVINVCKPKTHQIAGYTAAMKNMIGINSRKEYLPHHRKGTHKQGGDEYTDTHLFLKKN